MKYRTRRVIWLTLFALAVLAPLLIMVLAPRPAGRQFWRDAAVALGFLGLGLMGTQFIPAVRLPCLTDVYNLDTLYNVHHNLTRAAFYLVLAHPIILLLQNPFNFVAFNLLGAPWELRAGVLAFLLMLLIVATSVWRQWLKLSYEAWRILHDLMAVGVIGLALYHIFKVDYYTSSPIQRWLWILYGALWVAMILYIRVITPVILLRKPWRIADIIEERGNTWTLVLEPEGHAGMEFRAGQAAWLTIGESPFGIHEHPFSFSSSAEHPGRLEFAIRELGDFTSRISEFSKGTAVYVDGPYGTFDLTHHQASGYVFIAGGIGSAPIMSMLRTLAARGDERPLRFFYGNRTWDTITFREELAELEKELNLEVIHVLENPPEGWEGEIGFITKEVLARHALKGCPKCVCFICGPLPMIRFVSGQLEQLAAAEGMTICHERHAEQYEMA
ncbi:MAG: ferredoxin reductase family protein [Anaerolineae bacterium]